jgi:endonuclease/exonuclease/phosphatase family metal-dependent hydrolase
LGVFGAPGLTLELACPFRHVSRHVVPALVYGLGRPFLLLAVWARGSGSDRYVRGVVDALEAYESLIVSYPTVVMGDLNSNTFWDRHNPGSRNHTALVRRLTEQRIVSVYHEVNAERQGQERQPTFYLYNHIDKPYHIDYCFVPDHWLPSVRSMKVGTHRQWRRWSDHRPIMVDLDLEAAF